MNVKKFFSVAVFSALAICASAQLTNDNSEWARFGLAFDAQKIKVDAGGTTVDGVKTKGVAVEFLKGISLTNNIPLFLDLGGRLGWTISKEDVTGGSYRYNFLNVAVPVNAAYKLSFANSPNVKIVPFFGPNFKFNILARTTWDPDRGGKVKTNILDDANGGKVFQFGLNLGCGFFLHKFYVGYTFQPDLSPLSKVDGAKTRTISNIVSLSINLQ